jgi:hypothetical protein
MAARQVGYWAAPHVAQDMAELGYPPYFLTILGAWKVLGTVAIGAATGDEAATILIPLAIALVVAASWGLRPASRFIPRSA